MGAGCYGQPLDRRSVIMFSSRSGVGFPMVNLSRSWHWGVFEIVCWPVWWNSRCITCVWRFMIRHRNVCIKIFHCPIRLECCSFPLKEAFWKCRLIFQHVSWVCAVIFPKIGWLIDLWPGWAVILPFQHCGCVKRLTPTSCRYSNYASVLLALLLLLGLPLCNRTMVSPTSSYPMGSVILPTWVVVNYCCFYPRMALCMFDGNRFFLRL